LHGLRVLDVSIWRPGPYATQLLRQFGAEVLKVEPPGGDPMRAYPALFASLNAGKRGIALDLKDEGERARALELAADADVMVEGYRPGVAKRLGIGYDAIRQRNPSIIYCSLSGMGQEGPLADVSGHDLNYMAWSGLLAPEGGPPSVPAVPVADLAGGMAAALAICAAAVRRAATGDGERIDAAMVDVLATWTGDTAPTPDPSVPSGVPGYGTFETADGRHIALGVVTEDHFWAPLCVELGLHDVADLTFDLRRRRVSELQDRIAGAIASRPRDALVTALLKAGVPAAPVQDRAEMLSSGHLRARGVVLSTSWRDPAVGSPVRFATPIDERAVRPAPALDEHRGTGFTPR